MNEFITAELKQFIFVLLQASLFSDDGITKKELSHELDISPSTVDKRLEKIRNMEMLIEDKSGRACAYMLDLNKLS